MEGQEGGSCVEDLVFPIMSSLLVEFAINPRPVKHHSLGCEVEIKSITHTLANILSEYVVI